MIRSIPAYSIQPMRHRSDYIAIGIIMLLIGIFFFRLFFPVERLIVTPDFGRSDAWHFSFATKYALSQSLKNGSLPLWREDIGDGFPLLAEGQTGTYFLPNLILFSTLPPVTAYNIALVLAILTLTVGTYVVMRLFGFSTVGSLFASATLGFSGLPILQLVHIALLQGMSLMPVVFALTMIVEKRGLSPWMMLLALAITQQFLAGFPQATFLTLALSGSYVLWQVYLTRSYSMVLLFTAAVLLGFVGAAAQIIPSWEFLRLSTNPFGFDYSQATQYSMPLRHLITFLDPFALGNPKYGTYPPFYRFDGSIFWENTAFIGLLPLFFIFTAWVRKKSSLITFFTLLMLISILLAWGKNSPLYFVFTLWPLNLFRVPSRFLWLTAFSGATLAAYGFDTIVKHHTSKVVRWLLIVSILLNITQLFTSWWNYHLTVPAYQLLPNTTNDTTDIHGKTYTLSLIGTHNSYFVPDGWQRETPFIQLYTGAYAPDANILSGVNQHDIYAGRFLYRSTSADVLLSGTIIYDDTKATVSTPKMLDLLGIRTVISYLPIESDMLSLVQTKRIGPLTRRIYDNPRAVERAYLVREATTAATLNEAASRIFDPSFTAGKVALLETRDAEMHPNLTQFIRVNPSDEKDGVVTITANNPTSVSLSVHSGSTPALLILTDTYYPGWTADIDGKETPIYPANVKQRAIVIPKGSHTVQFTYQPRSVSRGLTISIITEFIVVLLMVVRIGDPYFGVGKKAWQNDSHPRGNLDT